MVIQLIPGFYFHSSANYLKKFPSLNILICLEEGRQAG